MFNPFKSNSTFQYCYRCQYWSGETLNRLKYRRSLRFLRLKYWSFLLTKWNFLRKGRCEVVLIYHDHHRLITCGNTPCAYASVEDSISNPKDFVGKLPDSPEEIAKAVDKIEHR